MFAAILSMVMTIALRMLHEHNVQPLYSVKAIVCEMAQTNPTPEPHCVIACHETP